MPKVWCWYKVVRRANSFASWSAIRVGADKQVDFCRGFVPSRAERGKVTFFTSDKAYERADPPRGDVGKR